MTAKAPNYRTGEVTVNIDFFDDAEPGTVLHTHQFGFPASYSLADMVRDVRAEGVRAKMLREQAASAAARIRVGQEVGV